MTTELTDEEKKARVADLMAWLEGKFPLRDDMFDSLRRSFTAKATALGMEVTKFELAGDRIETKVDFLDPRRELQQVLWRPAPGGIEILGQFPKDARYREAVDSLQSEYGPKLGLFLANRFAGLIRKHKAECITHVRVCCIGDPIGTYRYRQIEKDGCCASASGIFRFDLRFYRIGFNYGH